VTITRVGATQKYATGWEAAFGGKKRTKRKQATASAAKRGTPKKKATKSKRATTKKAK
jgi:hypothetical protein